MLQPPQHQLVLIRIDPLIIEQGLDIARAPIGKGCGNAALPGPFTHQPRLAARAREHLRNAEDLSGTAAKDSFAAILPITLARGYLRRIEAAAHNPFQEKVQQRMPGAAWTLTWARLRGRA